MSAADKLARALGILPRYVDQTERIRETAPEVRDALLAAMGVDADHAGEVSDSLRRIEAERADRALPPWLVLDADAPATLDLTDAVPWHLRREDGTEREGRGCSLPALPLGIHVLTVAGHETTLLAAPPALPAPPRGWGVTTALWSLRGQARPGFGDYADLGTAGAAMAGHGAAFLGINPIHAGFPTDPAAISPYSPSHRRRLNTLHIPTGDGVSAGPLTDWPTEIPAKRAALRAAYRAFEGDAAFDDFVAEGGAGLARFAAHQALSERHGPYWTDWPAAARDPSTADVDPDEARCHLWLQWRAHRALRDVQDDLLAHGMRYGLYLDLAVGTHPAGAETWTDRRSFAPGVSLGAPPDYFSAEGQSWGLAPLDPHHLVRTHFRVLAETLRAQFRYSRLIRIDHILGFERAFWVAPGLPGAYVAMPRDAMLAATRIEAARAGATVIGEDLGNIPADLQDALAASGILGCRLVQFERGPRGPTPPDAYAPLTLSSFGTHDAPTLAGWRKGAEIRARHAVGDIDAATRDAALADRDTEVAAFDAATRQPGEPPVDAMHRHLARSASVLAAAQIEDVLGVADQTNLPGTTDAYPNWRRKLPVEAQDLGEAPGTRRLARIMRDAGRRG